MNKPLTYAKAGVDIKKVRATQAKIRKLAEGTFKLRKGRFGKVIGRFGHYASLIDIGNGKALAVHADGVGTKVLIAQLMGKYDTIGIDCVAMNVNDLICIGAEPFAIIDYLAVQRVDEAMINEIMKGLAKGAELAGAAIVGGETAVMPGVIQGAVEGKGFDLAALSVGAVEQKQVITGEAMRPGDVIVGLESSGVHSNGLTLARKVLFEESNLSVRDTLPGLGRTIGEELLEPTRIYVKPVLEILKKARVHALAHITGGGFSKLKRFEEYAKVGFNIKVPKHQPIFCLIKKHGEVSTEEMFQTFNMGIGFCIVTPKGNEDRILQICKKHKLDANVIGEISRKTGVNIKTPKGKLITF